MRTRPAPSKRSAQGALTATALAIAVVSARHRWWVAAGGPTVIRAPERRHPGIRHPGRQHPRDPVEQVGGKVVPSVVKLETDLRTNEEGSGIVLSADGPILTNNGRA